MRKVRSVCLSVAKSKKAVGGRLLIKVDIGNELLPQYARARGWYLLVILNITS